MPTKAISHRLIQKLGAPILVVLAGIVVLKVEILAFEEGRPTEFWVGIFILLMLAMVLLVYEKKCRIRRAGDKIRRDLEVARLKLEAEKTGGFALIFAVGLFFQIGFDFDKSTTEGQAARWRSVNEQIRVNMTDAFCSVVPSRKEKCQAIKNDVNLLSFSIYSKEGESTQAIVRRIINTVRNELEIPQHSDQAKAFDPVLVTLERMDFSEGILHKIAKSLPIMSVLFGCFAVSSKIAVARVDFDEKQAKALETPQASVNATETKS